MKRKILTLFITILLITFCFTLVNAENSTTEILTNETAIMMKKAELKMKVKE